MVDIISRFKSKAMEMGERNLFNIPVTIKEIEDFEKTLKLTLPQILRDFFLVFNGGCFAADNQINSTLTTKTVYWNANYFLTLSEIIDAYNFKGDYVSMDLEFQEELSKKRLIPILHTNGQELLIWDATDISKTPILDAWHENNANEWEELYPSFDKLLEEYINKDGKINTIA